MNCCVCGRKIGIFEGNTFPGEMFNLTCPECSEAVNRLVFVRENSEDLNEYFEAEAELNRLYNLADHEEGFKNSFGEFLSESRLEFKNRNLGEEERGAEVVYTDPESTFMKTSGFGFEGYRIAKYIDVISAETILNNLFYSNIFSDSESLSDKLQEARACAMNRFVARCVEKGANAAIGVDFNYISFSANNANFAVIAHGTAVVVEEDK